FRAVRADQAGARPVGPAARLAWVRLRDRPLARSATARGARGLEGPAGGDRVRRGAVERLHGAGRDGEPFLAATDVPLAGGRGGGWLRAGGSGVARRILPGQAPRVCARDLLRRDGVRWRARDLAGWRPRRALRLARRLRRPRRPRLSLLTAPLPPAPATPPSAPAHLGHRGERVRAWSRGRPRSAATRHAAHLADARGCGAL